MQESVLSKTQTIEPLKPIPLRQVFPNEADLTRWLEKHIEALGDRLGFGLTVVQREKIVGDFNVDLLCEDTEGHRVIIENQLEKTNHDHLGKVLTYLVNLDATAAIWITSEARSEHQRVIEKLNESVPSDIAFYLVKVEVGQAGSSYFPLFDVLAGPDKQEKKIGEEKKEWADRHYKRFEFWKGLLARSRTKTHLFSNITPGRYHYIQTGAGKSGITFAYVINQEWGQVELYIDFDDKAEGNKAIFDGLLAQRRDIEKDFGEPLEWERLDNRRASRIRKRFGDGGLSSPETWPHLQDRMIDGMVRLDKALRSRVESLRL